MPTLHQLVPDIDILVEMPPERLARALMQVAARLHQSDHRLRAPGTATGTPPKSLMRMFSPTGNPNARNPLGVLGELQRQSGIHLHAQSVPVEAR